MMNRPVLLLCALWLCLVSPLWAQDPGDPVFHGKHFPACGDPPTNSQLGRCCLNTTHEIVCGNGTTAEVVGVIPDAAAVHAAGNDVSTATDLASAACWGGANARVCAYEDGAGAATLVATDETRATLTTWTHKNQTGSNWSWTNDENDVCRTWNDTTYQLTINTTDNCSDTFDVVGSATFSANVTVATEAYTDAGWNGDNTVPTKDAIRDLQRLIPNVQTGTTYTMTADDCSNTISANGANLEVELFDNPAGCVVCFFAETAHTITLDPNSTDQFVVNGLTPAAGDALRLAAAIGNNVCLHGKTSSIWYVFLGTGAVTDVN